MVEVRVEAVWTLAWSCVPWNAPGRMHPDPEDRVSEFHAHGAEHLAAGVRALAAQGHVRDTNDMGAWVRAAAGHRISPR